MSLQSPPAWAVAAVRLLSLIHSPPALEIGRIFKVRACFRAPGRDGVAGRASDYEFLLLARCSPCSSLIPSLRELWEYRDVYNL